MKRLFEEGNPGRPKGVPNKKTAFENFLFEVFANNKDRAEALLNEMFVNKTDFKWLMGVLCERMPKESVVSGDMMHTERKIIIELGANGREDSPKAIPEQVLPKSQ